MTHFLTVAEVAAIYRVDQATVRRWIRAGKLAASRIGRDWRIPASAVDSEAVS